MLRIARQCLRHWECFFSLVNSVFLFDYSYFFLFSYALSDLLCNFYSHGDQMQSKRHSYCMFRFFFPLINFLLQFAWLTVILLIYYFVTSFLKFIGTNSTSIKNTELEGSTMEIDILAFLKKILLPVNILLPEIYLFNVFLSDFNRFLCIQIG